MGRIRRLHRAIFTIFAVRLLLLHCTTDGGTNDRVIDAFAPFEGLVLRHIENDRSSCSIGVLMAFDDGAAQTHFWGALLGAPNSPDNQKVDNVIGKILDIVLLNSPMHRAITSHR